jgi:FkbM family methyltransferase
MDGRAMSWKWLLPLLMISAAAPACQKRQAVPKVPPRRPPVGACAGPPRQTQAIAKRTAADVCARSKMIETGDGLELWDTPRGKFWVAKDNFRTMCHVFGEQQAEIYGDAERGVHPGDIVLDCGAHFGGFVQTALARGAEKVLAIEINPEALAALHRTFRTEIAAGKVVVYGKGVWDKDETLGLERTEKVWSSHVRLGGAEKVQLTTIDKIVAELALPRVDFIKMDIEGAEGPALLGAKAILARHRPRMAIAAYHKPDDRLMLPAAVFDVEPAYEACIADADAGWGYATLFFAAPARRAPPRP